MLSCSVLTRWLDEVALAAGATSPAHACCSPPSSAVAPLPPSPLQFHLSAGIAPLHFPPTYGWRWPLRPIRTSCTTTSASHESAPCSRVPRSLRDSVRHHALRVRTPASQPASALALKCEPARRHGPQQAERAKDATGRVHRCCAAAARRGGEECAATSCVGSSARLPSPRAAIAPHSRVFSFLSRMLAYDSVLARAAFFPP